MKNYLKGAPATAVIAVACIAAWLASAAQAGTLNAPYYRSELALDSTLWGPMFGSAPYTAVTSAFTHLDATHLVLNMVVLVFIGREVECAVGTATYVAAYATAVLGSAATILWADFDSPTVGASGALFALMVLLIGVYRHRGMDLRAPIVLVAVNVVYTFIAGDVSLWGHAGGLFTGLVLLPFVFARQARIRGLGIGAVAAVAIVALSFRAGLWG
ncbi:MULTISPECIES: rhomboid family intramembrane serine protease [Corynebacterium]|uniref:rhomboid family intramembrane serine protease n=1 Tax=Corynebacterium TaxID=1716 RepID=UPI00257E298F|nr:MULTISPECIES: rhomboid family intramembrane serine protease [Corynebacterium]